jgi:hypothetical protein
MIPKNEDWESGYAEGRKDAAIIFELLKDLDKKQGNTDLIRSLLIGGTMPVATVRRHLEEMRTKGQLK